MTTKSGKAMKPYDPTELFTRRQVARRIKFSEHTIRKWVKLKMTGFPQPIRIGPQREHRWRAGDIETWIDRQERHPSPKRRQGVMREVLQ
jgi:predicted DNA-binding transcriptional regulator AlpA